APNSARTTNGPITSTSRSRGCRRNARIWIQASVTTRHSTPVRARSGPRCRRGVGRSGLVSGRSTTAVRSATPVLHQREEHLVVVDGRVGGGDDLEPLVGEDGLHRL